jgi:hypothetical protein
MGYKAKYLQYKRKYLILKNNLQNGGAYGGALTYSQLKECIINSIGGNILIETYMGRKYRLVVANNGIYVGYDVDRGQFVNSFTIFHVNLSPDNLRFTGFDGMNKPTVEQFDTTEQDRMKNMINFTIYFLNKTCPHLSTPKKKIKGEKRKNKEQHEEHKRKKRKTQQPQQQTPMTPMKIVPTPVVPAPDVPDIPDIPTVTTTLQPNVSLVYDYSDSDSDSDSDDMDVEKKQ